MRSTVGANIPYVVAPLIAAGQPDETLVRNLPTPRKRYYVLEPLGLWVKRGRVSSRGSGCDGGDGSVVTNLKPAVPSMNAAATTTDSPYSSSSSAPSNIGQDPCPWLVAAGGNRNIPAPQAYQPTEDYSFSFVSPSTTAMKATCSFNAHLAATAMTSPIATPAHMSSMSSSAIFAPPAVLPTTQAATAISSSMPLTRTPIPPPAPADTCLRTSDQTITTTETTETAETGPPRCITPSFLASESHGGPVTSATTGTAAAARISCGGGRDGLWGAAVANPAGNSTMADGRCFCNDGARQLSAPYRHQNGPMTAGGGGGSGAHWYNSSGGGDGGGVCCMAAPHSFGSTSAAPNPTTADGINDSANHICSPFAPVRPYASGCSASGQTVSSDIAMVPVCNKWPLIVVTAGNDGGNGGGGVSNNRGGGGGGVLQSQGMPAVALSQNYGATRLNYSNEGAGMDRAATNKSFVEAQPLEHHHHHHHHHQHRQQQQLLSPVLQNPEVALPLPAAAAAQQTREPLPMKQLDERPEWLCWQAWRGQQQPHQKSPPDSGDGRSSKQPRHQRPGLQHAGPVHARPAVPPHPAHQPDTSEDSVTGRVPCRWSVLEQVAAQQQLERPQQQHLLSGKHNERRPVMHESWAQQLQEGPLQQQQQQPEPLRQSLLQTIQQLVAQRETRQQCRIPRTAGSCAHQQHATAEAQQLDEKKELASTPEKPQLPMPQHNDMVQEHITAAVAAAPPPPPPPAQLQLLQLQPTISLPPSPQASLPGRSTAATTMMTTTTAAAAVPAGKDSSCFQECGGGAGASAAVAAAATSHEALAAPRKELWREWALQMMDHEGSDGAGYPTTTSALTAAHVTCRGNGSCGSLGDSDGSGSLNNTSSLLRILLKSSSSGHDGWLLWTKSSSQELPCA